MFSFHAKLQWEFVNCFLHICYIWKISDSAETLLQLFLQEETMTISIFFFEFASKTVVKYIPIICRENVKVTGRSSLSGKFLLQLKCYLYQWKLFCDIPGAHSLIVSFSLGQFPSRYLFPFRSFLSYL